MGYYETVNTRPVAFYSLDTAPYMDASINRLANLTLSNAIHPLPVFNRGGLALCPPQFSVPAPVTTESWAVGLAAKTSQGKLFEFVSSGGTGVRYQNGFLYFEVKHMDASTTVASAPYNFIEASNVLAAKDTDSLLLYVNGALLASKTIETTSPVVIGSTLTIGDASSPVMAGNVTVWSRPPSSEEVAIMDSAYRRYPYRRQLSETSGAAAFTPELISIDHIDVPLRVVDNSSVIELPGATYWADMDGAGMSVAGQIVFGHFIQQEDFGTTVRWDTDVNATVEFSTDAGTTWLPVNKGRPLPGSISPAQETAILIRVTFPSGQTTRPSITSLRIIDYLSNVVNPLTFTPRQATISGDVYIPETAHHPQLHGDGMRLYSDGIMEIAPDQGDSVKNVASLEFVFGVTTADMTGTKYIINSSPEHASSISVVAGKLNFSGFSSVYVNRVQVTSNSLTLTPGLNYHIVANYSTANNAKITFGSEGSSITGPISTIMMRDAAMNLAAVQEAFSAMIRNKISRSASENEISVVDENASNFGMVWTVRGT